MEGRIKDRLFMASFLSVLAGRIRKRIAQSSGLGQAGEEQRIVGADYSVRTVR